MASLLLQLHRMFDDWPDEILRGLLIATAIIVVIIALVPEQKALRMVTLAYVLLP